MTNVWRRTAALVAAIACGLMLALVGMAAADERHGKDEKCARGEAEGDGTSVIAGVPFNMFTFTVCRTGAATTDVTGFFSAVAPLSAGVVAVQGPVVCADFVDKSVSFLYTLNEQSTPGTAGTQILIRATDGGPYGAGDTIGFVGPLPPAAFGGNCDADALLPSGATLTALPLGEGDIAVDAGR